MSRSAISRTGTWQSSWQEIATLEAITRSGIARLTGRSIWRAIFSCCGARSMFAAACNCSHLRV